MTHPMITDQSTHPIPYPNFAIKYKGLTDLTLEGRR